MNDKNKGRIYVFGDCRLNAHDGRLTRHGEVVSLTPTLLEILLTLIEDAGRVVSKQTFLDRVWAGRVVEEGNLARNVSSLRKILGDDRQNPRYIETAPGRGYRFIAPVSEQFDAASNALNQAPIKDRYRYGLRTAAIAMAALLVAAFASTSGLFDFPNSVSESRSAIRSIVVLPLENLSGDPAETYLADGITEELISSLGMIGDLSITSRTSSLHYRASGKKLPEIADELGVQAAIEGSVVRAGESVRLSVRLVDAASDRSVWLSAYDRPLGELQSLYNEIAWSVADTLGLTIAPELAERLGSRRSVHPVAQEAYLLGLFHREKGTVDSLHVAIDYFEEAIAAQPDFAEAYASLGNTYLSMASWQGPSRVYWPKARAAANKAIELDSSVAEAYLVRAGAVLCHDLEANAADPIFRRALELNPGDSLSLVRYGYSLMTQGRFNESVEFTNRAIDLDPVSPGLQAQLGLVHHFARRPEEAIASARHALTLWDTFPYAHRILGLTYLEIGRLPEAIESLEQAWTLGGGPGVAGELGLAYALAGLHQEAHKQIHELEAMSRAGRDSAYGLALIHYGLGNLEEAFTWLDKAYGERDFRMISLPVDPIWDELRPDPRFQDLLVRIGLKQITDG